jgi:hypothetical protein
MITSLGTRQKYALRLENAVMGFWSGIGVRIVHGTGGSFTHFLADVLSGRLLLVRIPSFPPMETNLPDAIRSDPDPPFRPKKRLDLSCQYQLVKFDVPDKARGIIVEYHLYLSHISSSQGKALCSSIWMTNWTIWIPTPETTAFPELYIKK